MEEGQLSQPSPSHKSKYSVSLPEISNCDFKVAISVTAPHGPDEPCLQRLEVAHFSEVVGRPDYGGVFQLLTDNSNPGAQTVDDCTDDQAEGVR